MHQQRRLKRVDLRRRSRHHAIYAFRCNQNRTKQIGCDAAQVFDDPLKIVERNEFIKRSVVNGVGMKWRIHIFLAVQKT